ncbi:MAG: nucleotidyl transferase AbiEii/AbiGii toxin family protein [Candidatus Levybacteria bacterium]|nr:nucleotidyl transferase AbiEii/AbiGii toxin family protein [Candidatus Levybacteria bacterium]
MNKNILKIHPGVLDNKRHSLLDKLYPYAKDYILGGGTALALSLNHRKSFDFDFFGSNPIPKNLLEKLSNTIPIGNVAVDSADELTFFTKNKIKVTFLYYPFGHSFPKETLENGLKVFGIKDIAIKKAYTIGRRGEYRDYFDLYTILKNKYMDLSEIIAFVKKVYGNVFDEKIFLTQLIYFEDLRNFDIIPASLSKLPKPEEIKRFFENLIKNYV